MRGQVGAEVVLTSDRTLMSNYHNNEFLGFGTCAPHNFVPDSVFSFLFFPPLRSNRGVSIEAPYGLRKIEAQLLKEGFNVVTADPDRLEEFIPTAKLIGVYTMDPFGIGPASSTLAAILKKEPFLARHFRGLPRFSHDGKSQSERRKNRGRRSRSMAIPLSTSLRR